MRESMDAKRKRARTIITALEKAYPDAKCALDFTTPLELLVATILAAQCTDERVNIVTSSLFKKYRKAADYAGASPVTFEREMLFEMANGERIILDDIEAALRKLEKGGFGMCESCGKRILNERLRAMPWARYCIACQTRTEVPARA